MSNISDLLDRSQVRLKETGDTAINRTGGTIKSSYTANEVKTLINNISVGDGSIDPTLFNYSEIGATIETITVTQSSLFSDIKKNDFIYKNGDTYTQCDGGANPEGIIIEINGNIATAMIWTHSSVIDPAPIYEAIAAMGGILPSSIGLEDNMENLPASLKTIPVLGVGAEESFYNGDIVSAVTDNTTPIEAGYGGNITNGIFTPYNITSGLETNAICLGYTEANSEYPGIFVKCNQ